MNYRIAARDNGFTLLELLLAATVVSTLAAIAIPVYQNYTIRAKVSEAIAIASGSKTFVGEAYSMNGALPSSNQEAGVAEPASFQTAYVEKLEVLADGVIQVTMRGAQFEGHTVSLSPTAGATVTWICSSTLPVNQLPPSCRGTANSGGGGGGGGGNGDGVFILALLWLIGRALRPTRTTHARSE